MDIWGIISKILAIVGPILAIYLGTVASNLIKAIKTFVERFKTAYEDGTITSDEWRILIAAFLDVLIAALPVIFRNKMKAYLNGMKWEG